jgi:hypothetical protein
MSKQRHLFKVTCAYTHNFAADGSINLPHIAQFMAKRLEDNTRILAAFLVPEP